MEVPLDEIPLVTVHTDFEAVRLRLMSLIDTTQVFVFCGLRAHIAKDPDGTHRYLVHPDGRRVPLFELAETVVIDESGFVGEECEVPLDLTYQPEEEPGEQTTDELTYLDADFDVEDAEVEEEPEEVDDEYDDEEDDS